MLRSHLFMIAATPTENMIASSLGGMSDCTVSSAPHSLRQRKNDSSARERQYSASSLCVVV